MKRISVAFSYYIKGVKWYGNALMTIYNSFQDENYIKSVLDSFLQIDCVLDAIKDI